MNRTIEIPIIRRKFLVFDVETTGLIPRAKKGFITKIEDNPYIIQLSYAIYDLYERRIVRTFDTYVKVPETVIISEFITNLTGISNELCENKGLPIIEVIEEFYRAYIECDGIVAHNMDFDEKMINIEIERNREEIIDRTPHCLSIFNNMYEKFKNIERFCTMKKSIHICNLEIVNEGKPKMKKYPKLIELFSILFENEPPPKNLHNSMVDVLVCLKCFMKIRHGTDIDIQI